MATEERIAETPPGPVPSPEAPPGGRRGIERLLAVLGFGEVMVLTAAAIGTITLLFYLGRVLENQPAVLTPTATVVATPAAARTPIRRC